MMRSATAAVARSRIRSWRHLSNLSKPSRFMVARIAATWPDGRARWFLRASFVVLRTTPPLRAALLLPSGKTTTVTVSSPYSIGIDEKMCPNPAADIRHGSGILCSENLVEVFHSRKVKHRKGTPCANAHPEKESIYSRSGAEVFLMPVSLHLPFRQVMQRKALQHQPPTYSCSKMSCCWLPNNLLEAGIMHLSHSFED